jgi:hypothetical protein
MAGYTFSFWSSPLLPLVFFYFDNKYLLFPAQAMHRPALQARREKKRKKAKARRVT